MARAAADTPVPEIAPWDFEQYARLVAAAKLEGRRCQRPGRSPVGELSQPRSSEAVYGTMLTM